MLFNSWTFAAFLALVLPLYYLAPQRRQNALLLLASYVFYAAWDWRFLSLLWISTGVDYFVSHALARSEAAGRRRQLVCISLAVNLGLLGFFKYFGFFVESARAGLLALGIPPSTDALEIVLPVGISFYTFQTLSYTIDVYRRELEPEPELLRFALFVSWFPQLVAGPIERAARILPQIRARRVVGPEELASGSQLILWGFVKKVVVADGLAIYVDTVFSQPTAQSTLTHWLAVYAFALQIYCDFSGYTDIARGVSRLFGIELMENFRQPYFSRNVAEFWRRWHISLSTWLRDYLYIPLGGNRRGPRRQAANLMLTMLLGGLWHGASWTFVAWGGLHGFYLVAHRWLSRGRRVPESPTSWAQALRQLAAALLTFHLVCLAWVFFRAPDFGTAWIYLSGMLALGDPLAGVSQPGLAPALAVFALAVALLDLRCWRSGSELPFSDATPVWWRGSVYGLALFFLSFVRTHSVEPFLYFQF